MLEKQEGKRSSGGSKQFVTLEGANERRLVATNSLQEESPSCLVQPLALRIAGVNGRKTAWLPPQHFFSAFEIPL
jgi:hypothetical protein